MAQVVTPADLKRDVELYLKHCDDHTMIFERAFTSRIIKGLAERVKYLEQEILLNKGG